MKSEEKENLRAFFKEKRKNLSKERRLEASKKLVKDLEISLTGFPHVLSFASFKDEIDTWELNKMLCKEGRLLLPRVETDHLQVYHIQNLEKDLKKSKWGILEPDPKRVKKFPSKEISCALIPALGFDEYNHRLGYGKGHFDRFIEELDDCILIGIGFIEQRVGDALPVEEHDKELNHVFLF